jgi:MYXO-CTERM domain-containing protein
MAALGTAVAWLVAMVPEDALANGRLPATKELVISPTDPSLFAIEATFGLLVSRNAGASFGWVCEPALGYPATAVEDPSIGITPTTILAGIVQGVAVSTDQGCSWHYALTEPISDVVVRRDDPHSALALSSRYLGLTDAGTNAFVTAVYATHDDGATWAQDGTPIASDLLAETIDVAPSDANRIYIGGGHTMLAADGSLVGEGIVLASTNGGASYTTTAIPLIAPYETQGAAYVSAVDPTAPQRVYVRIHDSFVDRLLVSDDGAATFRTVYQAQGTLPGFALSNDGSTLFLGDSAAGVLVAHPPAVGSGAAFAFVKQSSTIVECLAWSSGRLYACTGLPLQLSVSTDEGKTFATEFSFGCIPGPLACPRDAGDTVCSASLGDLRASVGACPEAGADGSAPAPDAALSTDASDVDGGAEKPALRSSSCGCSAGEAGAMGGFSALALLALLTLRRRLA